MAPPIHLFTPRPTPGATHLKSSYVPPWGLSLCGQHVTIGKRGSFARELILLTGQHRLIISHCLIQKPIQQGLTPKSSSKKIIQSRQLGAIPYNSYPFQTSHNVTQFAPWQTPKPVHPNTGVTNTQGSTYSPLGSTSNKPMGCPKRAYIIMDPHQPIIGDRPGHVLTMSNNNTSSLKIASPIWEKHYPIITSH